MNIISTRETLKELKPPFTELSKGFGLHSKDIEHVVEQWRIMRQLD